MPHDNNDAIQDDDRAKYWAIIPAAGIGARMQAAVAKQYLKIHDKTILDYAIASVLDRLPIQLMAVAIQADDREWPDSQYYNNPKVLNTLGGATRFESVRQAFLTLDQKVMMDDYDWLIIHDGARPCLSAADCQKILNYTQSMDGQDAAQHGAILARPVADTLKRVADDERIIATIDRQALWSALTPQLFLVKSFRQALQTPSPHSSTVNLGNTHLTDESMMMEQLGLTPKVIHGDSDNIKLTYPKDLDLIAFLLARQGRIDDAIKGEKTTGSTS